MRHRNVKNHLNRPTAHRAALLRNLACALIEHEKIHTTGAKAKAVRPVVERMITLAKDGSLASRRQAFATLGKKEAVHRLFTEIGPRFADRPGGYTRIVKDGPRAGDGAPMAYIELVDRQIIIESPEEAEKKKTRAQRLREMRRQMQKEQRPRFG